MRSVATLRWLLALLLLPLSSPLGQADTAATPMTSHLLSLCETCQILILGERHRQPESPPLFFDLVTRLVTRGERVLVGLEISAAQQEALNAVLAGQRTPAGVASSIIDSPAYQHMLRALAHLYQTHPSLVTVVALDDLETTTPRDTAMATTLHTHLTTGHYDRAVVLIGNLHAIRKMRWAEDVTHQRRYLAEQLVDAGFHVTSVLQDLDAACDHQRHPTFYSITAQEGLEAARRRVQIVKSHPAMDVHMATDGVVVWRCPP